MSPVDQCSRCDMPGSVIQMTEPRGDGSAWIIEYVCETCSWHWLALAGAAEMQVMVERVLPLEAG